MRTCIAIVCLIMYMQSLTAQTNTLTLGGRVTNEKIYIQNPGASTHDGFCSKYVMINGKKVDIRVNQSTYEINLAEYGYHKNDSVCIQIVHDNDCRPRVLNSFTQEIKSPLFETESVTIDTSGNLKWSTHNENYQLSFVVEQFRWNKWIKVGEVKGKGGEGKNSYEYKVEIHSGVNKFRVKQVYPGEVKTTMTPSAMCISTRKRVTMKKEKTDLVFSTETTFELYDAFGKILKKGRARKLDLKTYKKGIYYVNYDNYSERLEIK